MTPKDSTIDEVLASYGFDEDAIPYAKAQIEASPWILFFLEWRFMFRPRLDAGEILAGQMVIHAKNVREFVPSRQQVLAETAKHIPPDVRGDVVAWLDAVDRYNENERLLSNGRHS
jgi:hypothetical protein